MGGGAQYDPYGGTAVCNMATIRMRPAHPVGPSTMEVPVTVTLEEAFSGTKRMFEATDGNRFEVNIPQGVKTGSKVRMRDVGGGDIHPARHRGTARRFERDGDNLTVNVPVDLYTAVLGGEVQVPTMDRPVF